MENFVFKKGYSKEDDCIDEKDVTSEDIVPSSIVREYIKFHNLFMRRLPKIVVKKDKETFERVVPKLDKFAKIFNGSIEATVDYEKWDSHIVMTLPFFEIVRDEERELFLDILKNSHGFNITTTEDGKVRIYILINYFEEIMPSNWDEMTEIADDVMLNMPEED